MNKDNEAEVPWVLDFSDGADGDASREVGDQFSIEVDAELMFCAKRIATHPSIEVLILRVDGVVTRFGAPYDDGVARPTKLDFYRVEPPSSGRKFGLVLRVKVPTDPSLRFNLASIFGHALSEPFGDG